MTTVFSICACFTAARKLSNPIWFTVYVVFMLVLVLVVVSVARGDMDNLGIAERNGKIILQLFLRDLRNPLFYKGCKAKKNLPKRSKRSDKPSFVALFP